MPYKVKTEGLDDVSRLLQSLGDDAMGIAARGLYQGAGIMAKEIRKQMDKIKTAPFKYAKNGETRLPSPEEKKILEQAGIGIAKFGKDDDEVNTSVGFNQSGYIDVDWNHMSSQARTNYKAVSLKYRDTNSSSLLKALGMGKGGQNQKPIGAVANAINSGTSFMKKQPFVRKGVASARNKAIAAIRELIEEEIRQRSGGK